MSMPLLRCRQVMPYLSAYVDGELDARLREQVETHLASCPKCSREVARYQAIDGLLLSLPASSPGPEVLDRILASTSSQNKEKAVRQSLRQPERVLAPRSVPAFLAADTNLAAPIPSLRQLRGRRPSWILATGLPTLAAILIIAMSLVFFHVRTQRLINVSTPTPTTNIEEVTQKQVDDLAPQLSFTPVMPTNYSPVTALKSTRIGRFSDGTKYLEVIWYLHTPLTTLRLREVGVKLADRTQYDYVEKLPDHRLTWMLPGPGNNPWQPMGPNTGNPGRLIVGTNFNGFSVTLDIGVLGGGTISSEFTALRLMSLSMYPGVTYQALASVFSPDSRSVIHYQISTKRVSDGKPYTWDVYWSNPHDQARATLSDRSGRQLYTDYMNNSLLTRCYPDSTCVALPPALATDPFQLGNKAQNVLANINPEIQNGELWNLGTVSAPSELGIGQEMVYALAFVSGPYPMTVYVSKHMVVVGVMSAINSPAPGGAGRHLSALGAGGGEL